MDKEFNLSDALISLYPEAEWSIDDNDYAQLNWLETNTIKKPTKKELLAEIENLKVSYSQKLEAEAQLQAEKEAAREAALIKLAALGLTEEELKAIVGN